MDNVINIPIKDIPDLLVGPFEEWQVVVDGRKMPLLSGFREGEKYWLVVDGRFACGPFEEVQAHQAARLAGECMAIISGYPNLRADNKTQPFAPLVVGLSEVPS